MAQAWATIAAASDENFDMRVLHEIRIARLRIPLSRPYRLAFGAVEHYDTIVVELVDDDGCGGLGEATVLTGYTDETIEESWAVARQFAEFLAERGPVPARLELLRLGERYPFTATAFATALEMLAGTARLAVATCTPVPILGLLHAIEASAAAAEFEALLADGYRTIKVKVGFDVERDARIVRMVQAIVRGRAAIRLDANQGYTAAQGAAFVRALDPAGIELFEQPCAAGDWESHLVVARASPVPLMLDESIYGLSDIDKAASLGAAAFIKVKLMKFVTLERLAQAVVEIGEHFRIGFRRAKIAQIQPLSGEIFDQRLGPGIGQHTPYLLFQHLRVVELAAFRQCQQLLVRDAAPQEKRQACGQFQVAEAIGGTRRYAIRIDFNSEQELRANQNSFHRAADSGFKSPRRQAGPVEAEQRLKIFVGEWPPISAPGQRGENRSGAALVLGAVGRQVVCRTAHKNPSPAGGFARPLDVKGSTDCDTGYGWLAALILGVIILRQPRLEGAFRGKRGLQESDSNQAQTGFHRQADLKRLVGRALVGLLLSVPQACRGKNSRRLAPVFASDCE